MEIKTGCILGKVNITDCIKVTKEFENDLIKKNSLVYGPGGRENKAGWKVENPILIEPIYTNGKLEIWEYKK